MTWSWHLNDPGRPPPPALQIGDFPRLWSRHRMSAAVIVTLRIRVARLIIFRSLLNDSPTSQCHLAPHISQPQAASIISRKSQRHHIKHRVSCNGVTKCDGNYRVSRKVVQVDLLRDTETQTEMDRKQGNIHTSGGPGRWSLSLTQISILQAGTC